MTKVIEKYQGITFESSSMLTPQFAAFARDLKADIKKAARTIDGELVAFNRGHFYCSGFIKRGDKFVYFSFNDVRWNDCFAQILVRTAKHEKDYSGGANCFATADSFVDRINHLLNQ